MTTDTVLELYTRFLSVAKTGGEEAARKFLVDNFKSFPDDMQRDLTLAFMEEAINQTLTEEKTITDLQTRTLGQMDRALKVKRILDDKLRLQALQSDLKGE